MPDHAAAVLAAVGQLVVGLNPHDGPTRNRTLLVDAAELLPEPLAVGERRYWCLIPTADRAGEWRLDPLYEGEADLVGQLPDVLVSIARTCLARRADP